MYRENGRLGSGTGIGTGVGSAGAGAGGTSAGSVNEGLPALPESFAAVLKPPSAPTAGSAVEAMPEDGVVAVAYDDADGDEDGERLTVAADIDDSAAATATVAGGGGAAAQPGAGARPSSSSLSAAAAAAVVTKVGPLTSMIPSVVTVSIFHSKKTYRTQEWLLLSTQTLAEFADVIRCSMEAFNKNVRSQLVLYIIYYILLLYIYMCIYIYVYYLCIFIPFVF